MYISRTVCSTVEVFRERYTFELLNIFLGLPLDMEAGFKNGQFAFTGFRFPATVPADGQSNTSVEESSAPLVKRKGVKDAVENLGGSSASPVVPKVPVVIPDRREGSSSGASVAVGTFEGNFPAVNSDSTIATGGATSSKKSKKRQERGDEELVSRVRELVIEDVRAEVRAGFEEYAEELQRIVRESRVASKVDDGLVVEGSHRVREKSKRHGKGHRKVQNEGEWII